MAKVTRLRDRRFHERGIHIEIIIMNIGALRIFEKCIQLRSVEAGQRYVEVRTLKISDQQR